MFLTVTPPWLTGLSDSSLSSGPGAADGEGSGAVHRRFWSGPQEVLERSTGGSGAVQRMSTIDYSAWDHIYVSDDEDVTSPFVDTSSLDAFDHELELLKERIHSCALIRTEGVTEDQEQEEEEQEEEEQEQQQRQRKLGPGGLDPVEVYQSLPKELQKSFAEKNLQMLQEVMNKLEPEEAKYHLKRCIDSGLWVPDTGEGDEEDEEDEEEDDDEDGGDKNNDTD